MKIVIDITDIRYDVHNHDRNYIGRFDMRGLNRND